MGIADKLKHLKPENSPRSRGFELKSRFTARHLVSPAQVTEQSLQVWRTLPAEIRHDPSMVSFQRENERLHGIDDESSNNDKESSFSDDRSFEGSEFLNITALSKQLNNKGLDKHDDDSIYSDHEHNENNNGQTFEKSREGNNRQSKQKREREKLFKRVGLLLVWGFTVVCLLTFNEKHLFEKTLSALNNTTNYFVLPTPPTGDFKLNILGPFNESSKQYNSSGLFLRVQPQIIYYNLSLQENDYRKILEPWYIPIVPTPLLHIAPIVSRNVTFTMPVSDLTTLREPGTAMRLSIYTNSNEDLAIKLTYNPYIINVKTGSLIAGIILLVFYALLVWEVFDRSFVAIICSIASIAVLACFDDRPNMEEIIKWLDMELLTLLFCMMIIVAVLMETGVFDYIAVVAFEISGGKIWPMIYSLCFITCLVSSFLDNVTTVLLMTPVAIRLCEVMSLDPVPVMMGIIVQTNIGGSLTPIGDPISIIICSNQFIAKHGVTFTQFVLHTFPGVLLTFVQSCVHLRLAFRDMESLRLKEPKEVRELRREIKVWQKAVTSIPVYTKDADLVRETIHQKVKVLKRTLRRKLRGLDSDDAYVHTLEDLKLKYPIKDMTLLIQTCCALAFVIVCFFIQSVPHLRTLPLGWVALLGVIALLIVLNREDIEDLMHRIEWTTLLFFAGMFVMMECVERLGLFTWIGEVTEGIVMFVDERHRLAMAIFIVLWISALASSILDSIPVTAMMVKVVVSLVAKESLGLKLRPLVWALAFGPSLGGNGTLYGATSNVISAGIAEQHGYKITFTKYLKIVFPMMLGQVALITIYLMTAHILYEWH